MASERVYLVGDAHLGHAAPEVADALIEFLRRVPEPGDQLVITGDLFDFWFEYRSVIPRYSFPVLAALEAARRNGVRLTLVGGNHDRWGSEFWRRDMGISFFPYDGNLMLAGWNAYVSHGDGMSGEQMGAKLLHRITRNPWTSRLFRLIHPDVGFWLTRRFSRALAGSSVRESSLSRAAIEQARMAHQLLERRRELNLVVMGHTHRPVLELVEPARWYLNPGAWIEGLCYAVVGSEGPELRRF